MIENNTLQNTSENIGLVIKSLRERKGISRLQLADGICSPSYLSRIEKGQRCPTSIILRQLAYRLKVTPEYLFDLAESENVVEFRKYIIELISNIERGDREVVYKLVNANKNKYNINSVYDEQFINSIEILCRGHRSKNYLGAIIELDKLLYITHNNEEVLTNMEIALISVQANFYILLNEDEIAYNMLKNLVNHIPNATRVIETRCININVYLLLSITAISLNQYIEALDYIKKGLIESRKSNFFCNIQDFLFLKAEVMYELSNMSEYKKNLKKAKLMDEIPENRSTRFRKVIFDRANNLM